MFYNKVQEVSFLDKKNIISINGGQPRSKDKTPAADESVLYVEGERLDLDSFILSGCTVDGKRVLLTWNTSLDELLSYNAVLNIVVQDKVRESVGTSPHM